MVDSSHLLSLDKLFHPITMFMLTGWNFLLSIWLCGVYSCRSKDKHSRYAATAYQCNVHQLTRGKSQQMAVSPVKLLVWCSAMSYSSMQNITQEQTSR